MGWIGLDGIGFSVGGLLYEHRFAVLKMNECSFTLKILVLMLIE